ncbi:MAG: LON peptidase substrate-binding domain-containing protein [Acidimicrobiales bacterium]
MLLPQFPLGSALVPGAVLPLQIFEPRYRAMAADLLDDGGRFEGQPFGVVLIERGHEVGGDDVRTEVGTAAKIIDHRRLPDGRTALVAVGTERFRVVRWLDDDPYPLAEIEWWPDDDAPGAHLDDRAETVGALLRRTWALAAEAGRRVGPLPEFDAEPTTRSFQLLAAAPLGPLDRHQLLCAPSTEERLDALETMMREAAEMFELEIRTD